MTFVRNLCVVFVTFYVWGCSSTIQKSTESHPIIGELNSSRVLLPNGWSITPTGRQIPLGDFPMNLVISSDKKFAAVTNNGQGKQSLMLLDVDSASVLDEVEVKKSWFGLVFNSEGTRLYASGGNDNHILVYAVDERKLKAIDSIELGKPWPNKISPTGLAISGETLFAVTKDDSSLYAVNVRTKEHRKLGLGHEAYTCLLNRDGTLLYISLWGGDKVVTVNTLSLKIVSETNVGSNPNDMSLTKDGRHLFVAHGNDNSVSIIATSTSKVVEVLNSAVVPTKLAGTTPNAVALSDDESILYIANADNNCVALFDVSSIGESKSLGFIPSGWYPTSVKMVGDKLWVTNGKGGRSLANPKGPNPYKKRTDSTQYIAGLLHGTLSIISRPDAATLRAYTHAVIKNTPFVREREFASEGQQGNPIPRKTGERSPIRYVFYIIKENRTYDQVFGDLPNGNGDSSLCLFPEAVTPNHHALAKQFVLLDNFYVNAEVSADGHNWSTAAYANDYVEKTWPTNYGGRGGTYDYEGSREIAYPKGGFIWDYCARAGVTYRSYGEFISDGKAQLKSLEGHFDPDFPEYNLEVTDMFRFEKWRSDFDSLLRSNSIPAFSTIRLPNDHTAGARIGMPTPRAMVAENDLALGHIVAYISKSRIWNESAIFVLEDDAQNGPDHVDAHRSIALVISPYAKRNSTVSTMYSTASMLRTMELILGLPPMSQYDAAATPMWECFKKVPDLKDYDVIPARYNIREMNTERSALSDESQSFNLEEIDAAPDLAFNRVIWKTIRGEDSEMPPPVRSAFISHDEDEDDEE